MKLIPSLLIAAALVAPIFSHANEPVAPLAKVDLAKGEATYAAVCASCHGVDGNSGSAIYPRLAHQDPVYVVRQLHDFKSGLRANAIMAGIAVSLSEDDMRNVAAWVGKQVAKPSYAKEKDLVVLGERIYRGGIADRQIAACAGCHTPNGAGVPGDSPAVAGLNGEYVETQLKAFRQFANKGPNEKVGRGNSVKMAGVTAKMNDREIKAVSDYIAGLR